MSAIERGGTRHGAILSQLPVLWYPDVNVTAPLAGPYHARCRHVHRCKPSSTTTHYIPLNM
jgi:hypothetical protein